jgi:acyl-homoserine lactone acylase PvdQ
MKHFRKITEPERALLDKIRIQRLACQGERSMWNGKSATKIDTFDKLMPELMEEYERKD